MSPPPDAVRIPNQRQPRCFHRVACQVSQPPGPLEDHSPISSGEHSRRQLTAHPIKIKLAKVIVQVEVTPYEAVPSFYLCAGLVSPGVNILAQHVYQQHQQRYVTP
eukprot:CAMPEP_0185796110 /NCGR_PEP_ID=MMETSP1174-20130828/160904_1 /TAXON_ID=35687 /ORGANISM="Dictyocha speculum, Strain CCMP1381" /LENGTH=105 /DNA_ID=CAMNT_0028491449 /DNA_START=348 /DNA_END=666 /DNA_ORIENTATION=+